MMKTERWTGERIAFRKQVRAQVRPVIEEELFGIAKRGSALQASYAKSGLRRFPSWSYGWVRPSYFIHYLDQHSIAHNGWCFLTKKEKRNTVTTILNRLVRAKRVETVIGIHGREYGALDGGQVSC